MDVVRLDPTTFLPDALIEGYSSMVWTERFSESGDFELTTAKMDETSTLLPEGSLISLRDSLEVMLVETHVLSRESDGTAKLVITGRTLETFLENRVLVPTVYGEAWTVLQQYRDAEFMALLLWNHLVNTTGEDPTRADYIIDDKTGVPNVVVTDSVAAITPTKIWSLEGGVVYAKLRDLLHLVGLGVRSLRPFSANGTVITFDISRTPSRGTVIYTPTAYIPELRLDVYKGTDRSKNQTDLDPVIFHYTAGHIDTPQYLLSVKELKDMVTIATSLGNGDLWPSTEPPPNTNVTGLNRRTLYFDGGKKGDDQSDADYLVSVQLKAAAELAKHRKTLYMDGAVSLLAPYKYMVDYFLGDLISVVGEFGFEENMIISEFVRTQDVDGDRGYPGLQRPDTSGGTYSWKLTT